jgi:hypothetical protein
MRPHSFVVLGATHMASGGEPICAAVRSESKTDARPIPIKMGYAHTAELELSLAFAMHAGTDRVANVSVLVSLSSAVLPADLRIWQMMRNRRKLSSSSLCNGPRSIR